MYEQYAKTKNRKHFNYLVSISYEFILINIWNWPTK